MEESILNFQQRKSTGKRQNLRCKAEKGGIEGKRTQGKETCLVETKRLLKVKSAEILRPLTFARDYATIASRKSNLRRRKCGGKK